MNKRARAARNYQREHGVSRREAFQCVDAAHSDSQTYTWAYISCMPEEFFDEFDAEYHKHLVQAVDVGMEVRFREGSDELVTTASPVPTSLPNDPFGFGAWEMFQLGRQEMLVLRLRSRPGQVMDGFGLYVVEAIHDHRDVYALAGTPLREVLDQFCSDRRWQERADSRFFANGEGVDGMGERVYVVDEHGVACHAPAYADACGAAERAVDTLGAAAGWSARWMFPQACTTPTELFHALVARGAWTDEWTSEMYERIAGRYRQVFGRALHPDDAATQVPGGA